MLHIYVPTLTLLQGILDNVEIRQTNGVKNSIIPRGLEVKMI